MSPADSFAYLKRIFPGTAWNEGLYGIILVLNACMQPSEPGKPDNQDFSSEARGNPVNHPPEIVSSPVTRVNVDEVYFYPASATDQDGDKLVWTLVEGVSGMNVDSDSGVLYGTNLSQGSHSIHLRINDAGEGLADQRFTLVVTNRPTIHSTPPVYIFSGNIFSYQLQATTADNTDLVYTLESGPAGMHIQYESGLVEWDEPNVGEHEITLSVTTSTGQRAIQSFSLTVLEEGSLGFVSEPETDAYELQQYHYQASILGQNETEVAYSLLKGAAGMELDPESGKISWIPETSGLFRVELLVTDIEGRSTTQVFDVHVHSLAEMDTLFADIMREIFASLKSGKQEAALSLLSGEARANYLPAINALLPYMEEVTANLGKIERISINPATAEYIIPRTLDGETRMFILTFVQNAVGEWKLNSL